MTCDCQLPCALASVLSGMALHSCGALPTRLGRWLCHKLLLQQLHVLPFDSCLRPMPAGSASRACNASCLAGMRRALQLSSTTPPSFCCHSQSGHGQELPDAPAEQNDAMYPHMPGIHQTLTLPLCGHAKAAEHREMLSKSLNVITLSFWLNLRAGFGACAAAEPPLQEFNSAQSLRSHWCASQLAFAAAGRSSGERNMVPSNSSDLAQPLQDTAHPQGGYIAFLPAISSDCLLLCRVLQMFQAAPCHCARPSLNPMLQDL